MTRRSLVLTFRNALRHKSYSLINIFGLTLGLTTSVLIFIYIQDEMSFDKMHSDYKSIYRIESQIITPTQENHWAPTSGFLMQELSNRYPEIKMGTRLYQTRLPETFEYNNQYYSESEVIYGDSTFFKFFSFKVVLGDPDEALSDPDKVVITQKTATKYFGVENPLNKTLKNNGQAFQVAAVVDDLPHNTHFYFDLLLPISDLRRRRPSLEKKGPFAFFTYLKLHSPSMVKQLSDKLESDIYEIYNIKKDNGEIGKPEDLTFRTPLIALEDIHFYGKAEKQLATNSNIQYIYIFGTVAIFIVLIASINYINLAIAKSAKRGKEVGMLKVLGASKKQVFYQFIGESFLFTFVSIIVAILLVMLSIPYLNEFAGKNIPINIFENRELVIYLLLVYCLVSFVSGIYPSLFLSRQNALNALKSNVLIGMSSTSTTWLRKSLIVLQFGISAFLIICVTTINRQLKFINTKELGFDKSHVIVIKIPPGIEDKLNLIKDELTSIPTVKVAATSSDIPSSRHSEYPVTIPNLIKEGNADEDNGKRQIRAFSTDEDIVEALGLEIVDGRTFSKEVPTDASAAFILNQAAIKKFNLGDDPIGKRFEYRYDLSTPKSGFIIGVVKDYHFESMHTRIAPLMIHVFDRYKRYIIVRSEVGAVYDQLLKALESKWKALIPTEPFGHFQLSDNYDRMYKKESTMSSVISIFTGLAIVIACMGLYALSSYITEQRQKEIGIRKVLGAPLTSIMYSLSKEFMLLILVTNILATAPSYLFLKSWLIGFEYRVNIEPASFIFAALISMIIASITISVKTYSAAIRNPVRTLRHG